MEKKIFRPPGERDDGAAAQAGGKIGRKRIAQIRPPLLDLDDARMFEDGLQAAAHGLDLWQFRHRGPS
jgi:hypothetical protein